MEREQKSVAAMTEGLDQELAIAVEEILVRHHSDDPLGEIEGARSAVQSLKAVPSLRAVG